MEKVSKQHFPKLTLGILNLVRNFACLDLLIVLQSPNHQAHSSTEHRFIVRLHAQGALDGFQSIRGLIKIAFMF